MPAVALNKPPCLDGMVGLKTLNGIISTIKAGSVFKNMAASFGANIEVGFQNALIAGPHGTGKTTFAKILAFEYRSAGIIPASAPILFVDAVDLAGEYCGQSEERTKKLLNSVIDGIIIIDEIDSLMDVSKFGLSVLNTLNVHMGNDVNHPIIIATCYASRKEDLLATNKGLEGRFRHLIHMPDYDIDDLADMFVKKAFSNGLICHSDVRSRVKDLLAEVKKSKGTLFANAREVQNIFDATIDNHAARVLENIVDLSAHSEEHKSL